MVVMKLQGLWHGRYCALLSHGALCSQHAAHYGPQSQDEFPLPQHSAMVRCHGPTAGLPESEER